MERFVNYSEVCEIDFCATGDVELDILEFKNSMIDKVKNFLDLGFTDAFLVISKETINDGTINVYASALVTDVNLQSFKDIQSFSIELNHVLKEPNKRELVLAYHLTTNKTDLAYFDEVFKLFESCSKFEQYIFYLADCPIYLTDCLFRSKANEILTVTEKSRYTIENVYGRVLTFSLIQETENVAQEVFGY